MGHYRHRYPHNIKNMDMDFITTGYLADNYIYMCWNLLKSIRIPWNLLRSAGIPVGYPTGIPWDPLHIRDLQFPCQHYLNWNSLFNFLITLWNYFYSKWYRLIWKRPATFYLLPPVLLSFAQKLSFSGLSMGQKK